MQRSWTIFFVFLLAGMAACAPARPATLVPTSGSNPATETPVPPPTNTPKPTDTPPPTNTPPPKETPTPSIDFLKYHEMPATVQEFKKIGSESDVFAFMDFMDAHPEYSHLTPGSEPPHINFIIGTHFVINNCNSQGSVNCAAEGFMQYQDQGIDVHVVVWSIRNKDGTIGYFAQYVYDSVEFNTNDTNVEQKMLVNPYGLNSDGEIFLYTFITPDIVQYWPHRDSFSRRTGYMDAINELLKTGIVPKALRKNIIII